MFGGFGTENSRGFSFNISFNLLEFMRLESVNNFALCRTRNGESAEGIRDNSTNDDFYDISVIVRISG